MTDAADRLIANMEGSEALPRKNGELVFEEPWEGRAFGIAVALGQNGRYDWEEFRQQLIAEIAQSERAGSESSYYERWLASLERLALAKRLFSDAELTARTEALASGQRDDLF